MTDLLRSLRHVCAALAAFVVIGCDPEPDTETCENFVAQASECVASGGSAIGCTVPCDFASIPGCVDEAWDERTEQWFLAVRDECSSFAAERVASCPELGSQAQSMLKDECYAAYFGYDAMPECAGTPDFSDIISSCE